MGKQTSTITMTGKLGNVVGYKMKGASGIRIKVDPKNPKTTSQMIQRMIFATATRAYSRMKEICDHSWEGVEIGTATQSEFIKRAIADLREQYLLAADSAEIQPGDQLAFSAREDMAMAGLGLRISNGSIPGPALQMSEDAGILFPVGWLAYGETISTPNENVTIANVLQGLGAEVGDQITLCALIREPQSTQYTFEFVRYVTRADATTAELAAEWPSEDVSTLPAAFDKKRTSLGRLFLSPFVSGEGDSAYLSRVDPDCTVGDIMGAAVIISRRGSNGSWLRSTAHLTTQTNSALYRPSAALPTWENNGTSIEAVSDLYLNNADH